MQKKKKKAPQDALLCSQWLFKASSFFDPELI